MNTCEIGNEYHTIKNIPRFDPWSEGIDMAYRILADKLSRKTIHVKDTKAKKKAKSKRRIAKQSRKRNR